MPNNNNNNISKQVSNATIGICMHGIQTTTTTTTTTTTQFRDFVDVGV
jgi:hypothetical protein